MTRTLACCTSVVIAVGTLSSPLLFAKPPAEKKAAPQSQPQNKQQIQRQAWREAQITRSKNSSERIEKLEWDTTPLQVTAKSVNGTYQPVVEIRGRFAEKEWSLTSGNSEIPVKNGQFTLTVPLVGNVTPIRLSAVSPFGETKDEKAAIVFASWNEFSERLRKQTNAKDSILLGLGLSSIRFEQTKTRGFSGTYLTLKTSYQGVLRAPNLDYGFAAFVSGFPIRKDRDDINAKFIGFNARVGYALGAIKEPWRLSILGGFYYTTMIAPFGYAHVGGPMLFPVLRYALSDRNTISCYAKFSPITNGLQFLSLRNRELAVGASWIYRGIGSHPMGLSLDIADLAITSEEILARSRSVSFGFTYGL